MTKGKATVPMADSLKYTVRDEKGTRVYTGFKPMPARRLNEQELGEEFSCCIVWTDGELDSVWYVLNQREFGIFMEDPIHSNPRYISTLME